ncbi:hypothetical protein KFL_005150060 [Klebsormidium nitens]|uniref:Uncharacterized protein n=1 Tax=Klebsormidium nitens TaxID=105231 RepID=A0A1Y1IFH1_KLENI|nr:hypothetical protein KFL_005150060 [Klebsormidium nitens]|eukprot:GAQ89373.1 hypothetical protein KFL_005150060 [Klebsormidium nitens]
MDTLETKEVQTANLTDQVLEDARTPTEGASQLPLWAGAERQEKLSQLVMDSYEALVHRPASWPALNMRLKEKGAKDILFGVEDVIKARGPGAVRALLTAGPPAVDADTVWSLHQPLLSLLLFILSGANDIHKKLIKVPDLKADICKALALGAPTKVKTPGPKPEAVHAVKKLKRLTRVPPAGIPGEDAPAKAKVIKRLIVRKPGEKRALDQAAEEARRSAAAGGAAFPFGSSEGPLAKKRKIEGDAETTIAAQGGQPNSAQLGRLPSTEFSLEPLLKKSGRVKKLKPAKLLESGVRSKKSSAKDTGSPKKARAKKGPGEAAQHGGPSWGVDLAERGLTFPAEQTQQEYLEDAEIAALVQALRARGARDVRAREEGEMADLDERVAVLEVQQRGLAAELVHLRAQREGLRDQRLGAAGEQDGGEPVRAARQKCLQAIVDLLEVLPAVLDLNAVAVFNELERSDAFDASLGALVVKQRAFLQRDWERKNALAAEAKRAGRDAMRKKDNVRQHLGILAASTTDESLEFDAVFSAFQLKLIELRRDMEQKVTLLAEKEKNAKQAWLVYRAAA